MKIPINVEIWITSRLLSGKNEIFTKKELTTGIKNLFDDTRPGISTHISSCCVANKPSNHPKNYNYLSWVAKGKYKIYIKGDYLHPDKINSQNKPIYEDVPSKFRYLLDKTFSNITVITKPSLEQHQSRSFRHVEKEQVIKEINLDTLKNCEQEAIDKTIVMMAYNPSCARIFSPEANKAIKKKIYSVIEFLTEIKNQSDFDKTHKKILDDIVTNVENANAKNLQNKISYGQAQKGLNVFLKVYVDWANRPSQKTAEIIRPLLHCPLDSFVMKTIKNRERRLFEKYGNLVNMKTYEEYFSWQKLITEIAEREDKKEKRTLIDVVWYLESLKKK